MLACKDRCFGGWPYEKLCQPGKHFEILLVRGFVQVKKNRGKIHTVVFFSGLLVPKRRVRMSVRCCWKFIWCTSFWWRIEPVSWKRSGVNFLRSSFLWKGGCVKGVGVKSFWCRCLFGVLGASGACCCPEVLGCNSYCKGVKAERCNKGFES